MDPHRGFSRASRTTSQHSSGQSHRPEVAPFKVLNKVHRHDGELENRRSGVQLRRIGRDVGYLEVRREDAESGSGEE